MAINETLARRGIKYIRDHPEEHNQAYWRCDSGMCFAGIVCKMAGGRWYNKEPKGEKWDAYLLAVKADGAAIKEHGLFQLVGSEDRAIRLLGITEEQAEELFHPNLDVEGIEAALDSLLREEKEEALA